MMGRSKSNGHGMKPADIVKTLDDPKVRSAVQAAQRALDEARDQLASRDGKRLQQQLARKAGTAVDATRDTMPPTMKDASERARELAERLRVEGQARSSELNQRLRDDVAPKAKSFAQEAIGEAEVILADARQRAAELSKNARRDYGPEVSTKANALAGILAAGATTGVQMLRDRAEELSSQKPTKSVSKKANRGVDKATSALQAAGGQAKYVASETMMLGFWAAILGATIYFALLTKSQRERVKGFFVNAFSQIQDVLGDFQDVGDEFPGSTR